MGRRNNGYTTISQLKRNKSKNGSSENIGRRKTYCTIGGSKTGVPVIREVIVGSKGLWNPGASKPSKRFVKR